MVTEINSRTQYIDALSTTLENQLKGTPIIVSKAVDFGDPVLIHRPDDSMRTYREAVGYFDLRIDKRTKRNFFWDKVESKDIARMAVYRDGELDIFVEDAEFNKQAELISRSFEELTGKNTNVYLWLDGSMRLLE